MRKQKIIHLFAVGFGCGVIELAVLAEFLDPIIACEVVFA